jgi:hypothetical protein
MAIQQPISTNTQNSPDHSLSHRVFANDSSSPAQSVVVNSDGTTSITKGRIGNVNVVTDTYIILVTDETVVCNKTTNFTVTLPTATTGQIFYIKNINTGIVTLEGDGVDTIDSLQNQTISQWDSITVQCQAANTWIII